MLTYREIFLAFVYTIISGIGAAFIMGIALDVITLDFLQPAKPVIATYAW